jgi:hypothetical protein
MRHVSAQKYALRTSLTRAEKKTELPFFAQKNYVFPFSAVIWKVIYTTTGTA